MADLLKPSQITTFEDRVRWSISKILRVPGKYRIFSCGLDEAARTFGMTEPLLTTLLDHGFPCVQMAGQLHFDTPDLWNIGLDLRLPVPHWHAMRLWSRTLRFAQENGKVNFKFTIRATCPRPGHEGGCRFEFNGVTAERVRVSRASPDIFEFEGSPVSEEYDFGESIAPIVEEARRLHFHVLPPELSLDIKFLNDSSLANCHSATTWLMDVAARHGLSARSASGLFVSLPYPPRHQWLEVLVAGNWRHADPFFLNALARWGVIAPDDRLLARSPQFIDLHLSSCDLGSPLVWHHGQDAAPDDAALTTIFARKSGTRS